MTHQAHATTIVYSVKTDTVKETCTTSLAPSIRVTESGPLYAHEGDEITFTITVNNTGNCQLYHVSVTDTLLGNLTGYLPARTLSTGEAYTFTFHYVVPSGSTVVSDTVTASGSDTLCQSVSDCACWTVTVIHPSILVTESGPNYAHAGASITYNITVCNTGDCPLYNVSVTGSLLGNIYSNGLARGQTKTLAVSYVIPLSSGDVTSTVTAVGSDVLGRQVSDNATWCVTVQYEITVTASPAGALGGTFNVTYTSTGTTYTNLQFTTAWTKWVDSGTIVTVSSPQDLVSSTSGTQYRFDHYDPSASFTMTGFANITLVYTTQYYLTVASPYDTPGGSGWYDAGSTAYATLTSGTVSGGTGTQYVFTSWSGDASGTNYAQSNAITMNGPKTATANWVTQYYLTVSTNFGSVTPASGWYDAGTVLTIQATAPAAGAGEQYVWNGWTGVGTGSYSGMDNPATNEVTMNGPISETASWTHQYYLTVNSAYDTPTGEGWYDAGSTATFSMTNTTVSGGTGIQYVFTGWSSSDTGGYTGTDVSHSVTMNNPITETASWKTQYYLTLATNPSGVTTPSGAGWYDADTYASISTAEYVSNVTGSSRYCFNGWTTSDISEIATPASNSTTVIMDQPKTVIASYVNQFKITFDASSNAKSDGTGIIVFVDGAGQDASELPFSQFVDQNQSISYSYVSQVPSTLDGKRYAWNSTSGLGQTLEANNFTVTEGGTVVGNYAVQYELTVTSTHDSPNPGVGEHWYYAGTSVTASVTSPTDDDGAGTRYRCTGWIGTGSVPTSGTDTAFTFSVNSPSTLAWNWTAQYYVTVISSHDSPTGEGWYDAGTNASSSVTSPVDGGTGTQYIAIGFDGTGSAPSSGEGTLVSFRVTQPSSITWEWKTQYYLTMSTNFGTVSPGNGWYDEGSNVPISATAPLAGETKGFQWNGWTGNGTISYSGLDNLATVTMNSPINETGYWKIIPELTIFISNETIARGDRIVVYGTTTPVSSIVELRITYTFPNGTQITHIVPTDNNGQYNDTLIVGSSYPYGLFAQGGQWTITAYRPEDADHEAATSSATLGIEAPNLYMLLPAIIALSTTIAVAVSYLIIDKRTKDKKLNHNAWWKATVVLGLIGVVFGAIALLPNWMLVEGTTVVSGHTYLVDINLNPLRSGSVSITGMQYTGPSMPSLVSSVWSKIPRNPGPITTLYLVPIGCALALASLYKPNTKRKKTIKVLALATAGALILIAIVSSIIFVEAQSSVVTGASTGYAVGLYVAMIGGLTTLLSSAFAAREPPPATKASQ